MAAIIVIIARAFASMLSDIVGVNSIPGQTVIIAMLFCVAKYVGNCWSKQVYHLIFNITDETIIRTSDDHQYRKTFVSEYCDC